MTTLDASELACLARIANGQPNAAPDCAGDILARLEALGLIERVPGVWLPLEMLHVSYRLTAAGQTTLVRQ